MTATLYLLPNRIAERPVEETLPASTLEVLRATRCFLAENAKSARAYLKAAGHPTPIAELSIVEIGHEPKNELIDEWLKPLFEGNDVAIVSESGCPGVADPGATIVARAQALLDGQHFRFLGYLPIKEPIRTQSLKECEKQSAKGETQIFIETPYRNQAFLEFLAQTLRIDTRITVACDITGDAEYIKTKTAGEWLKEKAVLPKLPTIFAILAHPVQKTEKKQHPKTGFHKKQGAFWRQA